ncbi:hypothetical protein SAMN05421853_103157 [Roseivivax halotolerans]|uniref:Uncharacterized protein n=1 Tax=Roseivivax halotolerans TaxID=93684 RepID=A0A1I5X637_9RHOB|nr:hypothetical protein [Roseivivax halotolerans]SFQ27286.1 hypothetical protein SAMN05421853_103157 [Roseivivax halotolerans]
MPARYLVAAGLTLAATPLGAGPFETETARAAFGAEIRELILDEPELVGRALNPPVPAPSDIYADARDEDLGRLEAERAALFAETRPRIGPDGAPVALAFLTGPDCADCAAAEAELATLMERLGLAATRLDASDPDVAQAMDRLTLDTLPSYVLPDMMVRGQIPPFVLERYISP